MASDHCVVISLTQMGALEDKIVPFGIPHWNRLRDVVTSVVLQNIVELNALAQSNLQRQQLPRVKEKAPKLAERERANVRKLLKCLVTMFPYMNRKKEKT